MNEDTRLRMRDTCFRRCLGRRMMPRASILHIPPSHVLMVFTNRSLDIDACQAYRTCGVNSFLALSRLSPNAPSDFAHAALRRLHYGLEGDDSSSKINNNHTDVPTSNRDFERVRRSVSPRAGGLDGQRGVVGLHGANKQVSS